MHFFSRLEYLLEENFCWRYIHVFCDQCVSFKRKLGSCPTHMLFCCFCGAHEAFGAHVSCWRFRLGSSQFLRWSSCAACLPTRRLALFRQVSGRKSSPEGCMDPIKEDTSNLPTQIHVSCFFLIGYFCEERLMFLWVFPPHLLGWTMVLEMCGTHMPRVRKSTLLRLLSNVFGAILSQQKTEPSLIKKPKKDIIFLVFWSQWNTSFFNIFNQKTPAI